MPTNCLICQKSIQHYDLDFGRDSKPINCPLCGMYRISESLVQKLDNVAPQYLANKYLYSAAIRENFEKCVIFWVEDFEMLLDSVVIPQTPIEKIDRLLLYISKKTKLFDIGIEYKPTMFPITYAKNEREFTYFYQNAEKLGYIDSEGSDGYIRLSIEGWKRVDELSQVESKSNQAFVAMWFNSELNAVWENGIKPALETTGYDAIRIDSVQHNGKIDDRIIAEIRKSGLLVADFTGVRGGVYFEAGFAMGLGIPVIWTCRKDYTKELHFDTRQYNHIEWEEISELREKLINRIEATLPNRPKAKISS